MNKILNNKGQSVVESAIALFVFFNFSFVFMAALYILFLSFWIPHLLYENNICMSSYGSSRHCYTQTKQSLKKVLMGLEDKFEFSFYKNPKNIGSFVRFKVFENQKTSIIFREELRL